MSAINTFNVQKKDIAEANIQAVHVPSPFVVEIDAPDVTIAATISQAGRPVIYVAHTLTASNNTTIEKEAYALVEGLSK